MGAEWNHTPRSLAPQNIHNTSVNASLPCQPAEESIEVAYDLPDEIQITSTETSSASH